MMSVKILLEVLIFSACLQSLALGSTENDKLKQDKLLEKLEKDVQSQGNEIKNLKKQIEDMDRRVDRLHPPVTCSALLKNHPSKTSGFYYIYAQGPSSISLVRVYCDMTSKNGVGMTVIGHDRGTMFLQGYESPGSNKQKIKYVLSIEHIVSIMKHSKKCEQFIRHQCYHSYFTGYSWWVSRQGWRMNYWGGAAVGSGKCACGMTDDCVGGGKCNCDKNDFILRSDSGYLTDKNTLPVTELRHGDTGDSREYAYYTLGKLRCWG